MKLDSKIRGLGDVYTCYDLPSPDMIGMQGYFADRLNCFRDLKKCLFSFIREIAYEDEAPSYVAESNGHNYNFFIPASVLRADVKSCSMAEFDARFSVGTAYLLRLRENPDHHKNAALICIDYTTERVNFGGSWLSLADLDAWEWYDDRDGVWSRFGG